VASVISRRTALKVLASSLAVPRASAADAVEKLRVGKAVSQGFAYIPLDVGMKHGIFQNQGLAIEEIDFAGGRNWHRQWSQAPSISR
jgi:ABC-type nitrate/sulfonate/bicarbonate transport system substrate-binding protein